MPLKYVHVPPIEKLPLKLPIPKLPPKLTKPTTTYASPSSSHPYACPYKGCGKAYMHEYKLNLHLKREHPGHLPDENPKNVLHLSLHARLQTKSSFKAPTAGGKKQTWPVVHNVYDDEDSEETEEDCDEGEGRWGYGDNRNHGDDDEETDYEN